MQQGTLRSCALYCRRLTGRRWCPAHMLCRVEKALEKSCELKYLLKVRRLGSRYWFSWYRWCREYRGSMSGSVLGVRAHAHTASSTRAHVQEAKAIPVARGMVGLAHPASSGATCLLDLMVGAFCSDAMMLAGEVVHQPLQVGQRHLPGREAHGRGRVRLQIKPCHRPSSRALRPPALRKRGGTSVMYI